MKRYGVAAILAALALPASASASTGGGVVLSVDAGHHAIEVVDAAHAVHLYRYRGHLPRLHAGSRVSFHRSGSTVTGVTASANASHTVVFNARVVDSSAHGVTLRKADGQTVTFSARQLKHKPAHKAAKHHKRGKRSPRAAGDTQISSGTVTINLVGLQPGVTVVVTETTDAAGNLTITIALPPSGQTSAPEHASGVITDVGDDAFVLETGDGSDLRLHMSADALLNLNLDTCSTADVLYHQDAGLLVADTVQVTGKSTSGDCTPTESVTGTIASVTGQGLTVTTDSGTMTFAADSSVTDGFQSGDLVDVTYTQGSDGSLTASDVQYVEENASGTVTAVQGTNLTITDSDTNQSETFVADANHGVQIDAQTFAGIANGDHVDVTYHQSAGHLIADTVCDNGTSGEN